jgi:tRNA U54 and U55 pseudouridine synthase Pus10
MDLEQRDECTDCIERYEAAIAEKTAEKEAVEDLTEAMAISLAEIDPNTENAPEGRALIKKMYKLKGIQPEDVSAEMPETENQCVEVVAGKVLQLEDIYDDLAAAMSFRDFFAEVYCSAFVNSLVTMEDGLSQIFPGGLDFPIEQELQRVYGPFAADQIDMIEIAAIENYMSAIELGSFATDDSILIPAVTPLSDALSLCNEAVHDEIDGAKQDREDYLNDYNFLNYLRTL